MDLLLLVAGLALLSIPLAVLGAAAAGDAPDLLAGLFRDHHDLGWPVGVQEEDLPPHVPLADSKPPPAPHSEPTAGPSGADDLPASQATAWRCRLRAGRVAAGTVRRGVRP